MPRTEGKALMDYDGGKIGVEYRGAECVLEAADNDRLINECIQWSAKAAPFRSEASPPRGWRTRDDQHLEVRSMGVRRQETLMQGLRCPGISVIVRVPIASVLAKRTG